LPGGTRVADLEAEVGHEDSFWGKGVTKGFGDCARAGGACQV
jgi:hypothetical protein